jgi:hypothetical protein
MVDRPGRTPDDFDEITEDDVLTEWEREFLASVGAQDYECQQGKLAEIESAIPLRLELARLGCWPVYRRR